MIHRWKAQGESFNGIRKKKHVSKYFKNLVYLDVQLYKIYDLDELIAKGVVDRE